MNESKFTIEQLITFAEGERDQCLEYEAEYPNAPDPESGLYDAIATALRMNAEMYARLTEVVECWYCHTYAKRMIDVVQECRATLAKARGGV